MNSAGSVPDPIVVRYLRGEESLESTATALAKVFRDFRQAAERGERRVPSEQTAQGGEHYEFTEADHPKLRALMDLVEGKLDLTNQRAREYLETAGNSAFDNTVRLLADDVRATLGETHVPVVWSFAAGARELDTDDPSWQFIENVQQYFQDTFVDTTWPACPRHPNHPLDHADGFWHCPRDKTAVARLGELSGRAGGT